MGFTRNLRACSLWHVVIEISSRCSCIISSWAGVRVSGCNGWWDFIHGTSGFAWGYILGNAGRRVVLIMFECRGVCIVEVGAVSLAFNFRTIQHIMLVILTTLIYRWCWRAVGRVDNVIITRRVGGFPMSFQGLYYACATFVYGQI